MRIRIGMLAAAALAFFLVAAWLGEVKAANAQSYWDYGIGNRVWGYTEAGQGWQWNGYEYEYGYYQAYSAGYQQGLSDAQAGLTYDCFKHTQYYCNGYSQGFAYENNPQQQTQNLGEDINVKGIGVNQELPGGIGSSHPALSDDNNRNGNGYDSSIQPGAANPSCKAICVTILK